MKQPIPLAVLALVALVVICATILAGLGVDIPTWFQALAVGLLTGGLGVAVPAFAVATGAVPTAPPTPAAPAPPAVPPANPTPPAPTLVPPTVPSSPVPPPAPAPPPA